MDVTRQLYADLFSVRERLRIEGAADGKEPKICSDESLEEIAARVPTRKADLFMIKGLGETFAEKYGDEFLAVTRKHAYAEAKSVPTSPRAASILGELEKKLINISKGNILLYHPRTVKSRTCDLLAASSCDPMDIIFRGEERKICDISEKSYADVNLIAREAAREYRERGAADLYVAYPFVRGSIGTDFPVRAPLALFPVTVSKANKAIWLRYDGSRDALYNNTLILANMKHDGKRSALPDNTITDVEEGTFLDSLILFYRENGIEVADYGGGLVPMGAYAAEGSLTMEKCAILGKFPLYSNSIERDIDELSSKTSINKILDDLINPESRPRDITKCGPAVAERDLTYINAINSAQEKVIEAMASNDELVVQGPPGTGKSQVITGIITTALNEGKTVLMVSEKKTALDVVHSRLGHLSKYAMMIDDAADKDLFYSQIKTMLSLPANWTESPADIDGLSDEIEKHISDLTRIADVMYRPGKFDVEPYKMYYLVKKVNMNDPAQYERYVTLKENISTTLMAIKYPEVLEAYNRFKDPDAISEMKRYYSCLDSVPWMAYLRRNMTHSELDALKTDILALNEATDEPSADGFVGSLFGKGQTNRRATAVLNRYFTNYSAKHIEMLVTRPEEVIGELERYDVYMSDLSSYESLPRLQRMYGENIISVNTKMPSSYEMSNDELFAFIMMSHLKEFEEKNGDILDDIEDFEEIRAKVDRLMADKRKATKDRIEFMLNDKIRALTESKMAADIRRIAESTRRWPVKKFVDRFGTDMFRGIRIWLTTPEAVSELIPLEMGIFDMLIFDEASQMYVEKGIPSIYRAKKVVVAGDHMQLRPSSLGSGRMTFDGDEILDEDSLLDLARSRYDSVLLNFHYRSKYEELIAFSNYAFYGGRLYVSPNTDIPELPPIETHLVENARWDEKHNVAEAEKVISILEKTLSDRKNGETIGVITFNVSQRDLIYDMIEEESERNPEFGKAVAAETVRRDNGEDVGLFLKNIESVQGDERDIIIFSVGYAKNDSGKIPRMFGWLNNDGGENRLNVAISRARRKIHIVTSFEPEELDVSDMKNEGPKLLKRYLEYAFAVSGRDRAAEDSILRSLSVREERHTDAESAFNGRICEALRRRGYDAETDFGIGGYSIDVAVRKGDRYVLGIECDSSLYNGSISTRERDYHRQKYLESCGWRIRRVWSNKWWNDPEKEADAIAEEIESL